MLIKSLRLFMLFIFCFTCSYAGYFEPNTNYQVCFTPGRNCTKLIVNAINEAKQSVLVQAYSFTSYPIGDALVSAKNRGVDVRIILDKSQYKPNHYSSTKFFARHNIPVWIDNKVVIAHNKVMVIDNQTVVTGSFNFTKAAQDSNAENVLIISSASLAKSYTDNWLRRQRKSIELANYHHNNNQQSQMSLVDTLIKILK